MSQLWDEEWKSSQSRRWKSWGTRIFFYHTVTCKTYKKHVKIYREVTSSQGANFLQYAVDNIVAWSNEWNLKLYDSEIVNRMS